MLVFQNRNASSRKAPIPLLPNFMILCLIVWVSPQISWAATLFTESFETEGAGTRWTTTGEFRGGTQDYFMRTNNLQNSGQDVPPSFIDDDRRYAINGATANYTGFDGSFVWAAEDVDDSGNSNPAVVTLNPVNVAGYTNLTFSGLFGGTFADTNDSLRVSYALDGSPTFTDALYFATITTGNTVEIALDTDSNGRGDAGVGNENVLGSAMKEFSFLIPNASTVSLRVQVFADASADEFAFDFFQIQGDLIPAIPEPGTGILMGIGLVGLIVRRRKRSI